jgi:hypothetical protein
MAKGASKFPAFLQSILLWCRLYLHVIPTDIDDTTTELIQEMQHQHTIPTCRATVHYAKPEDTSQRLLPAKKIFIQEVVGVLFY